MQRIEDMFITIKSLLDRIMDELQTIRNEIKDNPHPESADGVFLDFNEVCEITKMSERQVRRYREQGKLIGFQLDGRRLYRKSEVLDFIKKRVKDSDGWVRNRPKDGIRQIPSETVDLDDFDIDNDPEGFDDETDDF